MWRRVHDAAALGEALAELRRTKSMNQQDLADWLGVDRTTIVRLESGKPGPLTRLTQALAVLGADLVVLPRSATITVQEATDDDAGSENPRRLEAERP